jgi:3-hydroxybutyrate dehydrogenase
MLNGRRALITGSDSGLGLAIGRVLACQGADIVLHGICTPEAGQAAAAELASTTARSVSFERADLRSPEEIAAMMARLAARGEPADIVVNNAVIRHQLPLEEIEARHWDEAIAVNLSAAFHIIRLAAPEMRRRGWGRILNISSVFGQRADAQRIGYVTTKTGMIGLTRAVAVELASTGITCNAICPGTVRTGPILAKIAQSAAERGISQAEAERDYIARRHPTGRFVDAAHVGEMAAFLCGPAGQVITGACLAVDGGWTAGP